mgnify:FL=1
MDLSIVILHHGSPEEVSENLAALALAILPEKTEVLVVNNGEIGANKKVEFAGSKKFELNFFEIENQGYPQGNNFGLKIARGKFLCILNPDVIVQKNAFKNLIEYLNQHPLVGIVAPRLVYPTGKIQDNYRVFPRILDLIMKRTQPKIFKGRMRRYLMWDKDPKESEAVDWLTGAFQIITRKCWNTIGPNDERFFLFMSDVDICRLAWENGFEVHFVGNAEGLHNESRLSGGGVIDIFKKKVLRIHLKDAVKYYLKYFRRGLPKKCPSRN